MIFSLTNQITVFYYGMFLFYRLINFNTDVFRMTNVCYGLYFGQQKPILVVLILGYLELWCSTISELIAMCNAKSIHEKMLKRKAQEIEHLNISVYYSLGFHDNVNV